MRPGEFIHYIDVKGKAHNAQINVVRADSECEQPTVDLTYTDLLGKSVRAFDVLHFSHPRKQDTNPAMPTVHLHCWKGLEEQHNEPPPDHPLHDHPHIHPVGLDEQGNAVPKQRPIYESAVLIHGMQTAISLETRGPLALLPDGDKVEIMAVVAACKGEDEIYLAGPMGAKNIRRESSYLIVASDYQVVRGVVTVKDAAKMLGESADVVKVNCIPIGTVAGDFLAICVEHRIGVADLKDPQPDHNLERYTNWTEPHHPGNPETIHYPFECDCCGKDIIRLATHHGGKQFEKEPIVDPSTGTPTAAWVEHVCNPDDMKAQAEKAQQPKMEAHRDWCGSQAGKPCDCRPVVTTVEHPQEGVAPAEEEE